ncbi:MAG: 6-phospho-alpha-glucosidase [Anaerocolumna sp.]
MILTIAGGGSTFTPGITAMMLERHNEFKVTELRLYDNDGLRQSKIAVIIKILIEKSGLNIKLIETTDPKTAFTNANFIFGQFRVGKYEMREKDEKIPLKYGVIGQETCGPGGLAYGLRTIYPMIELIDYCDKYAAKDHWIINYSNPAAIVAEGCRKARPSARIINICDMPVALLEFMSNIIDCDVSELDADYYGLNHFGWFTSILYDGKEQIPMLRSYIEKNGLIGPKYLKYLNGDAETTKDLNPQLLRHLKASWKKTMTNQKHLVQLDENKLFNSYLQYYLIGDKIVSESNPDFTRTNEVIRDRETPLFEGIDKYLKTGELDEGLFYAGAHGGFIVDVANSLMHDEGKKFIVMVTNNGIIPNLPDEAIIEVPANLYKDGPVPIQQNEIEHFQLGMIQQQLASEKLIVEAAFENSYNKALQSFTLNATTPSVLVAKQILDEMIEANKDYWPELR